MGGGLTVGARSLARYGQGEVDGELPLNGDGEEVADGVQQVTEISKTWSSLTGASRGDGDERLESTAASAIVGVLEKLQQRAR
jgi:hypothetical protein